MHKNQSTNEESSHPIPTPDYITAGFRSEEEYNNFMDEHEEEFAAAADEFLRWHIDEEKENQSTNEESSHPIPTPDYITAGFRSEEEYNNFMDEHEEEFAAGADEFLRWYIDVESRH